MWLCDQIRAGLSGLPGAGGHRHAEQIAARMVDAQAPGVASALRRLSPIPVSGDGWPGTAARRVRAAAPAGPGLRPARCPAARAEGRRAVPGRVHHQPGGRAGLTSGRRPVAGARGPRRVDEPPIPARRIWLRGRDTGRFALLLLYAVQGNFGGIRDAGLTPGTELHADVHFYPGQPALRAVIGARHAPPVTAIRPGAGSDVATLLGDWAAALEQDPWLTEWPVLLAGTPVQAGDRWHLADPPAPRCRCSGGSRCGGSWRCPAGTRSRWPVNGARPA